MQCLLTFEKSNIFAIYNLPRAFSTNVKKKLTFSRTILLNNISLDEKNVISRMIVFVDL